MIFNSKKEGHTSSKNRKPSQKIHTPNKNGGTANVKAKLMCKYCRAIYDGKGWESFEKLDPRMIDELKMSVCPACHEEHDHLSDGVLHLTGTGMVKHKDEILHLMHNAGELEESRDILNRIERIDQNDSKEMTVYTTKNQLAVEL